ncbi:MAG: hypothetical protein ABI746_11905 [Dermatophilaceae bacterium]
MSQDFVVGVLCCPCQPRRWSGLAYCAMVAPSVSVNADDFVGLEGLIDIVEV